MPTSLPTARLDRQTVHRIRSGPSPYWDPRAGPTGSYADRHRGRLLTIALAAAYRLFGPCCSGVGIAVVRKGLHPTQREVLGSAM